VNILNAVDSGIMTVLMAICAQQFKAEFLKASPPNSLEGIEKYLGSGLIKLHARDRFSFC